MVPGERSNLPQQGGPDQPGQSRAPTKSNLCPYIPLEKMRNSICPKGPHSGGLKVTLPCGLKDKKTISREIVH